MSQRGKREGNSRIQRVDSWKRVSPPEAPEAREGLPEGLDVDEVPGAFPAAAPSRESRSTLAVPAPALAPFSVAAGSAQDEGRDLSEIRAAAARVADLESRVRAEARRADGAERREKEAREQVAEERRERRVATAAILRRLQATSELAQGGGAPHAMIAGPAPAEIRGSRRFAYAMAAASCLAVVILGWRLASVDADLDRAAERIEAIAQDRSASERAAARLAGERDAAAESLRNERQRSAELARAADEAADSARRAEAVAARALGVKVMLRTAAIR